MPFIKQLNKDFYIKDNCIYLSEDYVKENSWRFKKITGTTFGAVLGLNKYKTPLKAWANIVGIFKEEMDETLAKVGNTVEPKIRDYAQQKLNVNFKYYDPAAVKWNVFVDPIYGGIPDGEPINVDGSLAYDKHLPMIEIKSSSYDTLVYRTDENNTLKMQKDPNGLPIIKEAGGKRKEWDKNGKFFIPTEYKFQLGLYLYLRNTDYGVFAVGFMKPEDYKNPESFNPSEREIHIVDFKITNKQELEKSIQYGRDWYKKYITEEHRSPTITSIDSMWLKKELKI